MASLLDVSSSIFYVIVLKRLFKYFHSMDNILVESLVYNIVFPPRP